VAKERSDPFRCRRPVPPDHRLASSKTNLKTAQAFLLPLSPLGVRPLGVEDGFTDPGSALFFVVMDRHPALRIAAHLSPRRSYAISGLSGRKMTDPLMRPLLEVDSQEGRNCGHLTHLQVGQRNII